MDHPLVAENSEKSEESEKVPPFVLLIVQFNLNYVNME